MPTIKFIKATATQQPGNIRAASKKSAESFIKQGYAVLHEPEKKKSKVKVEIIKPFIEGQEKGDVGFMQENAAIDFEKQGVLKILEKQKTKSKDKRTKNIVEEIWNRISDSKGTLFLFWGNDKTKSYDQCLPYDAQNEKISDLESTINQKNKIKDIAVFMTYNPSIKSNKSQKEKIKKIHYVFIDLDDALSENKAQIEDFFALKDIYPSYIGKTGNGYHILVPVEFEPEENEKYVKGFLEYLKDNVCDKVDLATHTLNRLLRIPGSIHKKGKDFQLETLNYTPTNEKIIKSNSKNIKKIISKSTTQKTNKKKEDVVAFAPETNQHSDIFFNTIINCEKNTYIDELNVARQRNNIFLKNLGAYCKYDVEKQSLAYNFIDLWDKSRKAHLEGWVNKAKSTKMKVNYFELLLWAKEYKLVNFIELLEKQVSKFKRKYSAEEYQEALNIVKNDYPLKYCLDCVTKRHVGEREILLLLLFSGISPGLDSRKLLLHIQAVGSSGSGKTNCMESVGKIFSNMRTITSSSPKAIFYESRDKKLVDKGILFYPENDNKEDFDALERVLTDDKEGVPAHSTVINSESVSLDIPQKNVFWRNSVTTSEDEDDQLNNRYFIVNVDESNEQDDAIYDHILNSWNGETISDNSDLRIANAITDIIKSEKKYILIPYIRQIKLNVTSDRRILKKFLKLLTAVTYFNRFQRENIGDIVISYYDDFHIANYLWEKISREESSKLAAAESAIIEVIASKSTEGITPIELSKLVKKDLSNLSKKLKQLEEKGKIYSENETKTETYELRKSHKRYYASKWSEFKFSLEFDNELTGSNWYSYWYPSGTQLLSSQNLPKLVEESFYSLKTSIEKNKNSLTGTFSEECPRKEKKVEKNFSEITREIISNFNTSLSLNILPPIYYNKYKILYINNRSLVVPNSLVVMRYTSQVPVRYQLGTSSIYSLEVLE